MLDLNNDTPAGPVRSVVDRPQEAKTALRAALAAVALVSIAFFVLDETLGSFSVRSRLRFVAALGLVTWTGVFLWLRACVPLRRWRKSVVIALFVLFFGGLTAAVYIARSMSSPDHDYYDWRLPVEQLEGTPSALLVTVDFALQEGRSLPPERWVVPDEVYAASPVREPALASVLTGRSVDDHGLKFDGNPLAPERRTLLGLLAVAGFEVRVFTGGKLPDWCGAGERRQPGGLVAAVAWLADRARIPRFAHVHLEHLEAAALDRAVSALDESRVEVFLVSLRPSSDRGAAARFLLDEDVEVLVAWRDSRPDRGLLQTRPRSTCAVLPTLFGRLEVPGPGFLFGDGPLAARMDEHVEDPDVIVVSMAHGSGDRPHRILAHSATSTLAIEVTPLGGHATEDWKLRGPTESHIAYRNAYRGIPAGTERDEMLERVRTWRGPVRWRAQR